MKPPEDLTDNPIWLRAEIKRLRARTHEIQARVDTIESETAKRFQHLKIWEKLIHIGEDYYWDEAKQAKRPLNLSLYDAARFGLLVSEIERLRKERDDELKSIPPIDEKSEGR